MSVQHHSLLKNNFIDTHVILIGKVTIPSSNRRKTFLTHNRKPGSCYVAQSELYALAAPWFVATSLSDKLTMYFLFLLFTGSAQCWNTWNSFIGYSTLRHLESGYRYMRNLSQLRHRLINKLLALLINSKSHYYVTNAIKPATFKTYWDNMNIMPGPGSQPLSKPKWSNGRLCHNSWVMSGLK